MIDVALAAGFGSLRRFNDTFLNLFKRPPSTLRRSVSVKLTEHPADVGVKLQLRYRPPYDWDAMLRHLEARAIDGLEIIEEGVYRRSIAVDGVPGSIEVAHVREQNSLAVTVHFAVVRGLSTIVTRVGRLFDLDADTETIGSHLGRDRLLAPLLAQRPGLRVPGAWDNFEIAIRAILGQQVTVAAARGIAGRLVGALGAPVAIEQSGDPRLCRVFPSPESLAAADLSGLGIPRARCAALKAVAEATVADPRLFDTFGTIEETVDRLRVIRGVGDWTAQYIALRGLRETDAFPASDIGLLRGAALLIGTRPTPSALAELATRWRPWRAYAAQHLWSAEAWRRAHP